MIVNPQQLLDGNSITAVGEKQIQPNSIDLTVQTIYSMETVGRLTKEKSHLPKYVPIPTTVVSTLEEVYQLGFNESYMVEFDQYVKVPENMIAFVTHRSSLNRMGCIAVSGIFDSGFNGQIGAILYPHKNIQIEVGARIATIYFMEANSNGSYKGQYQNLPFVNKLN